MAVARELRHELETMLQLSVLAHRFAPTEARIVSPALTYLRSGLSDDPAQWGMMLGWLIVHALGKVATDADHEQQSRSWLDEWLLGRVIADTLRELSLDDTAAADVVTLIELLTSHQNWWRRPGGDRADRTVESLLGDSDVQQFVRVNRYQGVLWVHQESFERLLWWLLVLAVVQISADPQPPATERAAAIAACDAVVQTLQRAAERSGYQVEHLLEGISRPWSAFSANRTTDAMHRERVVPACPRHCCACAGISTLST